MQVRGHALRHALCAPETSNPKTWASCILWPLMSGWMSRLLQPQIGRPHPQLPCTVLDLHVTPPQREMTGGPACPHVDAHLGLHAADALQWSSTCPSHTLIGGKPFPPKPGDPVAHPLSQICTTDQSRIFKPDDGHVHDIVLDSECMLRMCCSACTPSCLSARCPDQTSDPPICGDQLLCFGCTPWP